MILISAGHNDQAKGAAFEGFSEYPETLDWAKAIVARLEIFWKQPAILVPPDTLTNKVHFINQVHKQAKVAIALEVHFNSGPAGRVRGSETLYCPGSKRGKQIAEAIQSSLAAFMPPNRGAKEGWYKMDRPGVKDFPTDVDGDETPDYFLRATQCPAVIVEPEFIQNSGTITANCDCCCEAIADTLIELIS